MHRPTLFILAVLLLGTVGLVMLAVWRLNPQLPGLKHWTRAYGYGVLSGANFLFHLNESPTLGFVIITHLSVMMMAHQCLRGTAHYLGKLTWGKNTANGLVVIELLAALWFTLGAPSVDARFFLASWASGLFYLAIAYLTLSERLDGWSARDLFAVACGLHGAFLLLRPAVVVLDATSVMNFKEVILIESLVALNLVGYCILALVNERITKALRHQANTDSLTGVLNHGAFMRLMSRQMNEGQRVKVPLTLLLLDIDHFKKVNDTHGHLVGDKLLQHFVQLTQAQLRQSDVMGRLGGEEFGLLLPRTPLAAAQSVAERLRAKLAQSPLDIGVEQVQLTVSIGVTAIDCFEPAHHALSRADAAMYEAKANGRNRVEVAMTSHGEIEWDPAMTSR